MGSRARGPESAQAEVALLVHFQRHHQCRCHSQGGTACQTSRFASGGRNAIYAPHKSCCQPEGICGRVASSTLHECVPNEFRRHILTHIWIPDPQSPRKQAPYNTKRPCRCTCSSLVRHRHPPRGSWRPLANGYGLSVSVKACIHFRTGVGFQFN